MATIRKRGNTYQVQVRRKGRPQLTKSFHRRSDALQWARQCEVEADRAELPADRKVLQGLKVCDLLERYRDTIIPRKRGRDVEAVIINALLRRPIAQVSLSDVRQSHFAEYRDWRLETVKAATINRELEIVQHV